MQKPQPTKETYQAPSIHRIRLVEGEVAVAGCKTSTSSMGPTTGCVFSMCKNAGS